MTTANPNGPIELAQTGKRDFLQALEKKYQKRWADEKLFEVDAPPPEEGLSYDELREKYPKWLGTFPYPYMNGSLHLGHAFTISKIEFGAGFERMLGKRALFPMAFHCTGMPIKAASDKIIREIEMFGPDFENYSAEAADPKEPLPPASGSAGVPVAVDKAKKGKVAAKATGLTYQFQIMESIGVPRAEIKKFADPQYWLTYFPPIAKEDNTAFGARIDWRRSFITTDANPYYDSFVRWQVNKLHKMNKIKFGERYTIYSPKDGQPCMDHDRQEGEGIGPQEYTGVKMEVVEWGAKAKPEVEGKFDGRRIFLVAATLRPETMYGQTNCFVGTAIKYGVFAINDKEAYVMTLRAARNMAYQGITENRGEIKQIGEIEGTRLIGTRIKAPFAINPEVYVLPMDNVLATKGTGVVTSVPSDSPDDFQTLTDLRKKPEFYGIDPKWAAIDPVPVITTPTYGDMTAPALVKKLKIQSQKDTKQLAEAKEIAYKEGFYSGTMIVGEFKGLSVQDAKPKVRESMIAAGVGFAYAEPEGLVVSRSTDECVVALMDQWYLDYGEAGWKEVALKLLGKMNTYSSETRNAFEGTMAWLYQWACARSYGLGSKLPWDPSFLVESLSDSTIYMSFYTIAHLLQGGVIDGSKTGPLGVTPEQLTDEVWDYVLGRAELPSPSPIDPKAAATLRHNFRYFYPMDIRSSGKDLINNHLTFCIYIHSALFPEKLWPLSMRTNGHLMLNGKKMSKSTGNFLTLKNCVEKFGADASRLALADAGDGMDDANFDEKNANANILRLHTLIDWCEEIAKEEASLRHGSKDTVHDRVFEEEVKDLINQTRAHYDATNYKDALKTGFYELQTARDWYREATADIGMHSDLVFWWIRIAALMVLPIAPHFSEHIWTEVLKEKSSVQLALWPTPEKPVDIAVLESGAYMRGTVKAIRDAELSLTKKKSKGKEGAYDPSKPKALRIFVASSFPLWQTQCVDAIKEAYDEKTGQVNDVQVRETLTKLSLIKDKRTMPFVQTFKKRIGQFGATTAFKRTLPFSEVSVLKDLVPYLKRTLNLVDADVWLTEDTEGKTGPGFTRHIIDLAEPGSPSFEYRNV
ncbi:leucyl-tRNA synthetase [Sistotremastrum niveocremeum HHB9708]|uniref:leucine--tRNA ligase n=1 Tax=Sistotremastrum niveocremeum HHB9708 TaxID=1314777 RepID=A0A164WVA7_9AGAM|nr:leucyl-tRNA synthetase [Sistotremastrum niveocremeum HHB9708]